MLGRLIALMMIAFAAGAIPVAPAEPVSIRSTDLDSELFTSDGKITAIVFLGTECPISRRAVPTLNELHANLDQRDVQIVGVISDPSVTRKAAATFRDEYKAAFTILFDGSGTIARQLKPTHVPEAFVLDRAGRVAYRGRIDDSFVAPASPKTIVSHHELADALDDLLTGRAVRVTETKAVGCIFEAWDAREGATTRPSVTYARDVAPILSVNCVQCHRDGDVAPYPLTSYEDVAKRAKLIASITSDRTMPPWKAQPNFGHFKDERRLSDDEIRLIGEWAEAGAPEGNRDDLLPPRKFASGWALGEPDLVIRMPEPFAVPASGRDVYRAFVAPIDVPPDSYVAAFEFRPDAASVVHHCIMYLDTIGRARQFDAADPEPGYVSFGGPGFAPTGALGGWAPGATPRRLPDGVGKPLPRGSDLVFQVHYHPDGREHVDRSSVAIYLAKKPVTQVVAMIPLGTRDIDIPAGEANYVREASVTLPCDATITGITPHMHLLGREMKVTATRPDGAVVPMIWIRDWDFRWQDQYAYAEPILLPKDTRIDLRAAYDNSADNPRNPNNPPRRVRRGEQTTDEMCLCFIQYQTGDVKDIRLIRRAAIGQRVRDALSK
jgi:peroxiredoxin